MSEIAISLKKISKCFQRYARPADRLKQLLFPGKSLAQKFWALHDINLEVPKGQTLGIVGRNGSGKSTLLQIIAATLTPTTGTVEVGGRISALLELGSGFNPEFTGRQNVFFNGQLLGLSRREIEDKFDDIASFAEIGDFLEQPVKTYSSGMFVRLAFAVATSAEPDILIVDEALSVGDEAFQRKCFARIQDIRDRGGTILFVSHAAATIVELCDRAILLDGGELILQGSPKLVVSKYQELIYAPSDRVASLRQELRQTNQKLLDETNIIIGSKNIDLNGNLEEEMPEFYDPSLNPENTISYISRGAKIINPGITTIATGQLVNHLIGRREYLYSYGVRFLRPAQNVRFGMLIKTVSGLELGGASFSPSFHDIMDFEAEQVVTVKFRFHCLLHPGVYFLNAGVSGMVDGEFVYLARCIDAAIFRVKSEQKLCGNGTIDFNIQPSLSLSEE
ncbi:MAG: ABC transporter ATP-binding protein [Hormoscilla sp. GUM202]|nr:ABC transporter ATP-binding protein [Hormoscilla sp. GUM202]